EDRQSAAVWSPDGKWIVFESDQAGGEINDLFAVPSDGGEVVNLTRSDDVSEISALWSPDGRMLAILRKPKAASAWDIALLDWPTRAVRMLTHEASRDHSWTVVAFSGDGRRLYANRVNAGFTDGSAWRFDVASGKAEELTPHKRTALVLAGAVSPDERF